MYPTTIPAITGSNLRKPFTYRFTMATVARTINAIGQFWLALSMAVGARFNPITIMIGPVITGGSIRCMNSGPRKWMRIPKAT